MVYCMHACVHTHIHTYKHACIHTYIHTSMRACMHAYIHTYTHIHIHTYTHTHTHTHIHTYTHAQDLKRIKKQKMKDIIKAMEAFNENLVGGKRLVKALERDTPIGTMGNFFYFFFSLSYVHNKGPRARHLRS